MQNLIIRLYVFIFARVRFEKINNFLYRLSLGGLGILNYQTSQISGEKNFLKKYLQNKKGVILDVGANEGSYTMEALEACSDPIIYAFEPHPVTFERLTKNTSIHPSVETINCGLSDSPGELTLFDYEHQDGSSHASLFSEVITEIHGSRTATGHRVNLSTLDGFLDEKNITEVLLLKIDTEGNELAVLQGGLRAIQEKRIKAIHFEFNEMNAVSHVFFRDFWRLLDNYRIYRLLPNEMLEIKRYNPISCEIFAYQNIVAILKD